ncbi:hypothetical protein MD484_g8731, partial [Candolleomyces efflorescens]
MEAITANTDRDLSPLHLKGRHPRMPALYKAASHPKHPASNPGNTYVFYTRPTEARMQELLRAGEAIAVQGMSEKDLIAAGFLKLLPGDYLLTRNELGSRAACDDVPVSYVVGPELRCPKKMFNLDLARDKFMGPVEEITETSVHFERLKPKPKPVKEGTRCWSLGTTLEPNTNIEAPCANTKANNGVREYHDIGHDIVVASTKLAMEDIGHAPEGIREVLKAEFDRHGGPPLGCAENYAYHSVQCNLAFAGRSMEAQMGRYAGIHRDERDCPGHYSTMFARSKLPPNYEPARMILPGLGVYVDMNDFVGLTFQARHEHVGSPAYPKPGTEPSATAYRLAFIHYTSERVASGGTRQRIGALPTTQAFLAPEMRTSKAEKDLVKALQTDSFANFIRDGNWIMEDDGFVPYVGRVTYMVVRYLLMQAHSRFEFELDPVQFAQSISWKSSDGSRYTVPAWDMAPTVQGVPDHEREIKRQASEANFKEHLFKHGSLIPSSFNNSSSIKDEAARRYGPSVRTGSIRSEDGCPMIPDPSEATETDKASPTGNTRSKESTTANGDRCKEGEQCSTRKRKRARMDEDGREGGQCEGTDEAAEAISVGQTEGRWQGLFQSGNPLGTTGAHFRSRSRKPATKEEESFKLLRELTIEAIEDEVLELRAEIQAEEEMQDEEDDDYQEIRDNIDEAHDAVENGGVGETALVGVAAIVKDARLLLLHVQRQSNRLRELRRSLIKAQTALRSWVEGPVAQEAYHAANKGRSAGDGAKQSWVSKLTNDIVDMLVAKQKKRLFKAKDYGLKWRKEVNVDNSQWRKNMLRGQEGTTTEAVSIVVKVVEKWVNAEEVCDKKQAWFASVVEEVMGEEALTMNLVWKLYQDVKPAHIIPGDKGYRNPTKKDVEQFRASLENHSVVDQDHREGQLFELYKQLLKREVSPSDVVKSLPSVSPTWTSLIEMIQVAAVFDNDEQPNKTNRYFKKLQDDPQTYHPMRERTSSRHKCRRELTNSTGAFTHNSMFSLIVWRVYPQAFAWHPERSMLYSSPDGFLLAYAAITKASPSKMVKRTVERIWSSLKETRTDTFTRSYPTFEDCYQHFRPNGALETRIFPGLSRTGAFDVACDLAYAGICQPPTTADVAKYIVHMNQGAMTGLKALGLMDSKKIDIDAKRRQVHQALLDLGSMLITVPEYGLYEKEVADEYGLELYRGGEVDPMGVEHILRNFSHARKYLDCE